MRRGIIVFFIALTALAALRVSLGLLAVPIGFIAAGNWLLTAIFIGVPIFALYRAASEDWTSKLAGVFVIGGLVLHFGLFALVRMGIFGMAWGAAIAGAIAQIGLVCWCAGLGALLATLLKDKNLLIPVSIFLAGFDIFLVLTPIGPTQQILKRAPEVLPAIGLQIPKMVSTPTHGPVGAFAFVGPADFLFMGMFFVAMFRFGMRTRETFWALIPAVLTYLLLTPFFGALPLLVPIGLTVLLMNIREFSMNKEEQLSTGLIAVIALALIAFGATRPAQPAVPLQTGPGSASQGPVDSPAPVP